MAFTFAAFCYILALILCAVLIFFAIFHIIAFDELKTDYKNPIDQCNSLNPLVLPEYIIHIFFTCLFLFAAEWLTVILNIPLIAYHIKRGLCCFFYMVLLTNCTDTGIGYITDYKMADKYASRPVMSAPGLYDPTSIMNADELNRAQKEGWVKLAFYLISFFYYLYSMIFVLVSA